MAQYAKHHKIDELLIAVHPKHVAFYKNYWGFDTIGGQRDYPQVCGNPAVALCLNLHGLEARMPKQYKYIFGDPLPKCMLEIHPMPWFELSYFALFVDELPKSLLRNDG
jgi:hypothetical protein